MSDANVGINGTTEARRNIYGYYSQGNRKAGLQASGTVQMNSITLTLLFPLRSLSTRSLITLKPNVMPLPPTTIIAAEKLAKFV